MQTAEKAIRELKLNIAILDLGNIILDSLIVFTIVFLIGIIFNLNLYFAVIPSFLYFLLSLYNSFKANKNIVAEEKTPDLKEKLRTVADNITKFNPIIDSLKEDVVKDMSSVRISKFINFRTTGFRVIMLTLLSIAVILVSFANIKFSDMSVPIISQGFSVREAGQEIVNQNTSYLEGNVDDILGKGSVAKLGTKELELIINPLASDADVNNIKKVAEEDFNPPIYPKEIYSSYDISYNEKIAKENQQVVKEYFEKITE